MQNFIDAHRLQKAKAWINFDGTGVIAIRDSFNISGIVDNGVGDYTVNWDLDFLDNPAVVAASNYQCTLTPTAALASARICTQNDAGVPGDASIISVIAFGDR